MLGDADHHVCAEHRQLGRCTAALHPHLEDNTKALSRTLEAGGEQIQPSTEMFYDANSASVRDAFGHVWVFLTWREDLGPCEMERRARDFFANAGRHS